MSKVDNVLRETIENGGGTFASNLEPFDAEFGFIVGLVKGTYALVPLDDLADNFNGAVKSVVVNFPGELIGTWVHDGNIHVDPVTWEATKDAAMATARKNHQIAIWDCLNKREIDVS